MSSSCPTKPSGSGPAVWVLQIEARRARNASIAALARRDRPRLACLTSMNVQRRSKLAKIGGVAPCLGRNHGDPRGKQGQAMLHETGKRDAILVRPAFGDRSKRCPIASEQSACDPAGPEQANDAADDAGKRDAQHQRDAGIGIGREIGRVGLSQRQLHRDVDGKHGADARGRGPRGHPAEQHESRHRARQSTSQRS